MPKLKPLFKPKPDLLNWTPGLPNCEGNLCTYLHGGYLSPTGVILQSGVEERGVDLLRLGACSPNATPVIIAVGGGGQGGNGYVGGGGSGYVEYRVDLPLGSVQHSINSPVSHLNLRFRVSICRTC